MPVVVYTLLRAAVLLVATGLLWWAGMRSWLAPLLGAVIAWAVSYALLGRQRDAAARHLASRDAQRRGGAASRAQQDADAEDAAVEDAAARHPEPGTGAAR